MRPLPRVLAYLEERVAAREDLGVGLAAIAAAGPAVALVARIPGASIDALTALTARCLANARPPEAEVFVSGRGDVALATGAHGIVARRGDLPIHEMRRLIGAPEGERGAVAVIAAVHSIEEAHAAHDAGADGLVVGTIWPSASHPGREGAGPRLIEACATVGIPVWAIGGVTIERARAAHAAGAWGVAAIGAIWDAPDRFAATMELLRGVSPES